MELEYAEGGRALIARFSCPGQPGSLKSGGQGWFERSSEIDWLCGCRLWAQHSVTVPGDDYGFGHLKPKPGTSDHYFSDQDNREKAWDSGSLLIEGRSLKARFPIPDCLDHKKLGEFNFTWGQPILLDERMFHCQLLLKTGGPSDGHYMSPRATTRECAGGIDFLNKNDIVVARACHSEGPTGRGRVERVWFMCRERGISLGYKDIISELPARPETLKEGSLRLFWYENQLRALPRLRDLDAYVDANPSQNCT